MSEEKFEEFGCMGAYSYGPAPEPTLLEQLAKALTECADDLEAELEGRYSGIMGYPINQRRFANDMSTVRKAREALAAYEKAKPHA